MGKKRKGKGAPSTAKRALPYVAGAVIVVAALLAGIFWPRDGWVPINDAYALDGQTLLVVGNSGSDVDVTRWSTIGLLGPDGVVRNRVHEKGAVRVIGVTDDVVWLEHPKRHLHARRLPGLELVDGIGEAIASHPVLSNGYQVAGFTADGAVLSGPDRKRYRVGLDAAIDRASDDLDVVFSGASIRTLEPTESFGVTFEAAQAVAKASDTFTNPIVIRSSSPLLPLALPDPPGFLVRSFDFRQGGQTQSLHRVGLDGAIAWSLPVETMMDAVEIDGQMISMVWVGMLDGQLSALVQLTEYHPGDSESDGYSEHEQRLVDIDPETGAVTNRRPVMTEKS